MTSWRKIAERLAAQLEAHAFCPTHPLSAPGPDCPYCQDRAAYHAYLKAGGRDVRPTDPPGNRAVTLTELTRRKDNPDV